MLLNAFECLTSIQYAHMCVSMHVHACAPVHKWVRCEYLKGTKCVCTHKHTPLTRALNTNTTHRHRAHLCAFVCVCSHACVHLLQEGWCSTQQKGMINWSPVTVPRVLSESSALIRSRTPLMFPLGNPRIRLPSLSHFANVWVFW